MAAFPAAESDAYELLKNFENGDLLNYLALVDNKHDFGGTARCLVEEKVGKITRKKERVNKKEAFDRHWRKLLDHYKKKLAEKDGWRKKISQLYTGPDDGGGHFEGDFMEEAFKILSKKSPHGPHLIKGDLNLYEKDVGTYENLTEPKRDFIMTSDDDDKTGFTYKEFKRFFNLADEKGNLNQSFYTCHDSTTGSFIWKEDESAIPVDERKNHFVLLLPQNSFDGAKGKSYGAEDTRKGNDNYWEGRHGVELDIINENGNVRDHWVFRSNIITRNDPNQKFIFKIKNPKNSNIKITRITLLIYKILKKKMDYKHLFQIKKRKDDGDMRGEDILLCEFNGNSSILRNDGKNLVLLDFNKDSDVTFAITETCANKFSKKKQLQLEKGAKKSSAGKKSLDMFLGDKGAFDRCKTTFKKWYSGFKPGNQKMMESQEVSSFDEDLQLFYKRRGKFEAGMTESGPTVGSLCAVLIERNKKYFEDNIGNMCNHETLCYKLVKKLHNLRHSVKLTKDLLKGKAEVNGRFNWHDMTEEELFNIILDLKRAGDWEQALACLHHSIKIKDNSLLPQRCIFFSGDNLCFLFAMLLDIDCVYTNNTSKHYFYRSSKTPVPTASYSTSGGGNKISLTNGKLKYNLIGGDGCGDLMRLEKERSVYKNEIAERWNESFIAAVDVGLGDPNTDHYRYIHLNNPGMEEAEFEEYIDDNHEWLFDDEYTKLTQEQRVKKFIPNIKKAKIILIVMGLFYELLMSYTAEHGKETAFEYDHNTINHNLLKQSIFYPVVFSKEYKVNNSFEQLIGLKPINGLEKADYLLPIQTLSYCEHAFYFNLKETLKEDLETYLSSYSTQEEAEENLKKYLNDHGHFKQIQRKVAAGHLGFEQGSAGIAGKGGTKEAVKNLIVLRNFLYGGTIEYLKASNTKVSSEDKSNEIEQEKIDDISYLKKIQEINYKFYKKLLSIRNILKNNRLVEKLEKVGWSEEKKKIIFNINKYDYIYSCEELQFEHIFYFTEKINKCLVDLKLGEEYKSTDVDVLGESKIDLISDFPLVRQEFMKNIAYEFMNLLKRIRTLTLERIFFSNIEENFIQETLARNIDIDERSEVIEASVLEKNNIQSLIELQKKELQKEREKKMVSEKSGGNKKKKKKLTKRNKLKLKKQRKRSRKKTN